MLLYGDVATSLGSIPKGKLPKTEPDEFIGRHRDSASILPGKPENHRILGAAELAYIYLAGAKRGRSQKITRKACLTGLLGEPHVVLQVLALYSRSAKKTAVNDVARGERMSQSGT